MSNNQDEKDNTLKKVLNVSEFNPPARKSNEIFYCNLAKVSSNLFDIRIDVGQRSSVSGEEHRGDATIMMSPQHAKELFVLLARVLGDYERRFGKIPSEYEVNATIRAVSREEVPPFLHQKIEGLDN